MNSIVSSQLIEDLSDFDLIQNQRIVTASREHLNQMLRLVEERIFPVLLTGPCIASRSSLRPSTDHEDILWLLGVIWAWRGMLREQIQWEASSPLGGTICWTSVGELEGLLT